MTRFIFFTKTRWDEPPRLRHQLTELLASSGHSVLFAETPYLPGQSPHCGSKAPSGVQLFRHGELLHHKLRIGPIARWVNTSWTGHCIAKAVQKYQLDASDVIVNFNYDYYFLRQLFPSNTIVTIINDDFVNGKSKSGKSSPNFVKASLEHAQRLTCSMSDAVLTPSVALKDQLAKYCAPELFMPWANIAYQQPLGNDQRDLILYWGYIGRRLDYAFLNTLAARLAIEHPSFKLIFVGPVEGLSGSEPLFNRHPNVEIRPAAQLADLPLERMIGSIVPYSRGEPEIDVIVLPNKAMPLLARGLPLLITGMPRFIEAPFVFRLDEGDTVRTLCRVRDCFSELQPAIRAFVDSNGPTARLDQFKEIVCRAQAVRNKAMARSTTRSTTT
jgi:hypothetical protein